MSRHAFTVLAALAALAVLRRLLSCAWLIPVMAGGCDSRAPATSQTARSCPAVCSGSDCDGCDPKAERCDSGIVTGRVGVNRWPDPNIGPDRVDAAIRRTDRCGGVKWPFATTNHVCGVFSTWLEDAGGKELPGTRYDSTAETVQIYGNMWSGAARACASVCGQSVCSSVDP